MRKSSQNIRKNSIKMCSFRANLKHVCKQFNHAWKCIKSGIKGQRHLVAKIQGLDFMAKHSNSSKLNIQIFDNNNSIG